MSAGGGPSDTFMPPEEGSPFGQDSLSRDVPGRPNSADVGRGIARLLPKAFDRAPLAIAAFLAIPLFFSSLMASTLALERPHKIQWQCHGGICTVWHDPTGMNTAKIWLWAFVPPLVLVLIGWIANRIPYGFYVSCVAAIVIAMAVVHKTGTWARHHTLRFPNGVDLIPSSAAFSNLWDPGEWEQEARDTAISLQHWTIGIAIAAMVVQTYLLIRGRQRKRRAAVVGMPIESVHAPDATLPGTIE